MVGVSKLKTLMENIWSKIISHSSLGYLKILGIKVGAKGWR